MFGGREKEKAEVLDVEVMPDDKNANRGTKRGLELLEKSMEKFGMGRPILLDKKGRIVAGNKAWETAREKGFKVKIIKGDANTLFGVLREDVDLDTPKGREQAIAENRVGQVNLDWDPDMVFELRDQDNVDFSDFFFDDEMARMLGEKKSPDDFKEVSGTGSDLKTVCPRCNFKFNP